MQPNSEAVGPMKPLQGPPRSRAKIDLIPEKSSPMASFGVKSPVFGEKWINKRILRNAPNE